MDNNNNNNKNFKQTSPRLKTTRIIGKKGKRRERLRNTGQHSHLGAKEDRFVSFLSQLPPPFCAFSTCIG